MTLLIRSRVLFHAVLSFSLNAASQPRCGLPLTHLLSNTLVGLKWLLHMEKLLLSDGIFMRNNDLP